MTLSLWSMLTYSVYGESKWWLDLIFAMPITIISFFLIDVINKNSSKDGSKE